MRATDAVTSARRYDDACGTALALEFLGERWSLLIMRELMFGPRRFGDIRANLVGISANVLTQRLEALDAAGIVRRVRLPAPAAVPAYALTPWGLEAEAVVQAMGRWATRSPLHDPMLAMSPASAMLSLRAMVDAGRAAALAPLSLAIRFPDDAFAVRITADGIVATRGEDGTAPIVLAGDTMAFRRTIYGKEGFDTPDTLALVAGDRAAAVRFVDLFGLPEKIAPPPA